MGRTSKAENAAYATAYWFLGKLCPNIFPIEKMELAAETAIRYYATHKSPEECLSCLRTYRLDESTFWQGLGGKENEAKPANTKDNTG